MYIRTNGVQYSDVQYTIVVGSIVYRNGTDFTHYLDDGSLFSVLTDCVITLRNTLGLHF